MQNTCSKYDIADNVADISSILSSSFLVGAVKGLAAPSHLPDLLFRFHSPAHPLFLFFAFLYAIHAAKSSSLESSSISVAAKTPLRATPPQGPNKRLICHATAAIPRFPCTLADASDLSGRARGAFCMRKTETGVSGNAPPNLPL